MHSRSRGLTKLYTSLAEVLIAVVGASFWLFSIQQVK